MTEDGEGGRPGFDVTRRGYRTSQVDEWVDRTTERLDTLEHDLDDARALVRSLQSALDEARTQTTTETFGARAEKVLRLAEHDARLRRERADTEAEQIRELVHFEAERTVTEARAEAGRTREAAERDADRIRAEAERDASEIRAAADRAADSARAEVVAARRDADLCADTAASMHEHVRTLRSAVRDEIARLHTALGAELRELDAPVVRPRPSPTPAPAPAAVEPETPAAVAPEAPAGTPADDGDRPAVARVVVLPEQRDRSTREQVEEPAVASGE